MRVHGFNVPWHEHHFVAWVDAARANRLDGKSTGGLLIGCSDASLVAGAFAKVSTIAWGSYKLPRHCPGSTDGETQAATIGEDRLWLCRLAWAELNGVCCDRSSYRLAVRQVPGHLVSDSRGLYDAYHKEGSCLGIKVARCGMEILGLREAMKEDSTVLHWVNSDAQLGDGLTKASGKSKIDRYLSSGRWRIVYDPDMVSAKRRKAAGIMDGLANPSEHTLQPRTTTGVDGNNVK